MQDREHILRILEWLSGARLLYNYIWIGGLYYDLPVGFEEKCLELADYLVPRLLKFQRALSNNVIFINRTANVGVLSYQDAINYGCTGPVLRASGLAYDIRKVDNYSVYSNLDFEIPIGNEEIGKTGDCWNRNHVRILECYESLKIVKQCANLLLKDYKRTRDFDPRGLVPKRIRFEEVEYYSRAENPKGELGFFFKTKPKSNYLSRLKVRSCCFSNLSVLSFLAKGHTIADLVAILGSLDFIMGEVDR